MVMNLQFFGGRGSSSGITDTVKAVSVNMNGNTVTYRQQKGRVTDIDGYEEKSTNGLTVREIAERAKQNGYEVKTYTQKQLTAYEEKKKAERQKTDDLLNSMSAKDRTSTYRRPGRGWKGH